MTDAGKKITSKILNDVLVNKDFIKLLSENNLSCFEDFYSLPVKKTIKKVRDERSTGIVELLRYSEKVEAYRKISRYSRLASLIKTIRKFTRQRNSLLHEYLNLVRLRDIGVPSITPIAAGTKTNGLTCRSFILSQDLGNTEKLEDYLSSEFTKPSSPEQDARKKLLINTLAVLTRKMHEGGVNHRDYYLCHIHILKESENWPELFIIDLNRADRRKKVGMRWRVKDVAALNYSAQPEIFSRADRMRFLLQYLGQAKLDDSAKRFIRMVIKKTSRIARHAVKSKERDRLYMEKNKSKGASC